MAAKKYEKHLAYYQILETLRSAKRCAFCELERKGIQKFFDGLFYEKVNDRGLRDALVKSRGFCARHAHFLVSFGDGLGTAILYADQVELRMKSLDSPGAARRRKRPTQDGICPACRALGRLRAGFVHTLLQGLADPEMSGAFATSAGLCFPHFQAAIEAAQDSEVKKELVRIQKEKTQALLSQLKELIDKYDYRRIASGFKEEKDSWMRAVEMVSGLKDVF